MAKWINDTATDGCPCVMIPSIVAFFRLEVMHASSECASTFATSGSNVSMVSSADAAGVAVASGAHIIGTVGAAAENRTISNQRRVASNHSVSNRSVSDSSSSTVLIQSPISTANGDAAESQYPHVKASIFKLFGDCKDHGDHNAGCQGAADSLAHSLVELVMATVDQCAQAFEHVRSNKRLIMNTNPTHPSWRVSKGASASVFNVLLNRGYFKIVDAEVVASLFDMGVLSYLVNSVVFLSVWSL